MYRSIRSFAHVALACALVTLSACTPGKNVADYLGEAKTFVAAAVSTVTNPFDATDTYRIRSAQAVAEELLVKWRRYCWARPYSALMADPVGKIACTRRLARLNTVKIAEARANAAIEAAEKFIADNPTLSATDALSAAWNLVQSFQAAVPKL